MGKHKPPGADPYPSARGREENSLWLGRVQSHPSSGDKSILCSSIHVLVIVLDTGDTQERKGHIVPIWSSLHFCFPHP